MVFECPRCGKTDEYKNNMRKHLKRKKICESILSNLTQEECLNALETGEVITLVFLKKQLSIKDVQLKEKDDQIKKLQDQLSILMKKETVTQSFKGDHNTANNNCNNTYIQLTVNSYEKTDYTVLKDEIHTCIKDGKIDEAKLIKLLHFNKDHPENQNIKIVNKRENRIKVYNGTEFEDSDYVGKDGIFKFGQDTLKKTEEHQILDDEKYFANIEDPDINPLTIREKKERVNKVETVIYNGNKKKLKKKNRITT